MGKGEFIFTVGVGARGLGNADLVIGLEFTCGEVEGLDGRDCAAQFGDVAAERL